MLKAIAVLTGLLLLAPISHAQVSLKGQISDSLEKKKLPHGVITLLNRSDSTLAYFTRTDKEGHFSLAGIDTGSYLILITYPRFADYMEVLHLQANQDLGAIPLTLKSKVLSEVVIRSGAAVRMKGDTTEFTADSFQLKQGATVEDLLKKLPGFTVNSKGEIVAQGKRVDKVLVDGEEFFGDDPTMATQNISGKAVDKVQLFDTKTEQQQLTGISTGNEGKTVNIKLKEEFKKGSFGKVNAGTDFSKYHDTKLLYNRFVGKKKVSVYGTKTNTSTGSLNWEDREKLGMDNDFEYDEINGYYFSFGGSDDFDSWNFRGLPDAYTAGALFSNKWNADKHNVNGSYRFNRLASNNEGSTLTQNILPNSLSYSNTYTKRNALNQQHVFSGKYEWKIDSLASIKLVSVNTFKNNNSTSSTRSEYLDAERDTVNTSHRVNTSVADRNQTDNQLVYKQLFKKKNRIWMTTLRYGLIEDENEALSHTAIRYFLNGNLDRIDTIDQQKIFDGRSSTLGVKSTFSEPLSSQWTLVVDYAYNKNHSTSLRNTYEKAANGKYEVPVNEFSNNFELDAFSHTGNAIARYNYKKINLAFGSGLSAVELGLSNLNNNSFTTYHFLNITPQTQFVYTFKPQTSIRFNYRGTTRQPTINQLQPLRDNTDPLNEYRGNPDLKVGFNHNMSLSFHRAKTLSQTWMSASANYSIQQNAITQFNTIDAQGKRTYFPVNVNGNSNWNMWGSWSKRFGAKKPSLGFQLNGNGGRFINFINGQQATTTSSTFQFGFNTGLNIDEKFELWMNWNIAYNRSESSLPSSIDNNYFSNNGNIETTMQLPWNLELNTEVRTDLRQRINAFATNTNLVIWNASLVRKLFKDKTGSIGIYANDILNDNQGFTRTINSTFITDDRFQRVSQYFLLRFEWSFTKMPGGDTK